MKPEVEKPKVEGRGIEIAICFVISLPLIFHFLMRPESAMTKAVVDDDVVTVRQLIRISRDLDMPGPCRKTQAFYSTPLIEAARLGRGEIAQELLNAGANVNARDEFGTSPLVAALSRGDIQISLALLKKGANPNLATCMGHGSCTTALRCAQESNNAQLIRDIVSVGGIEETPPLFFLECFWMNIRPPAWFSLTQIVPLVLVVMLSGSLLRRTFWS
jgi:hypothetical protein